MDDGSNQAPWRLWWMCDSSTGCRRSSEMILARSNSTWALMAREAMRRRSGKGGFILESSEWREVALDLSDGGEGGVEASDFQIYGGSLDMLLFRVSTKVLC